MNWNDDTRDGILFRFWITATSDFPSATASAIAECLTPAEYRRALTGLAQARRVNLPAEEDPAALLQSAGATAAELRTALGAIVGPLAKGETVALEAGELNRLCRLAGVPFGH